jgi:curved DNA-binding protein
MDYYETLGVPRTATQDEIKKAYRKLASQHHPDKGGDTVMFQKIQTAYDTLGDANKRAMYDNPQPQFGGFAQQGFDINDLFSQIFGQGGVHRNPHGQRTQQQVYRTRVTVSLVDAYNCADQVLQLNTPQGLKVINIKIPRGTQTGDQVRYDNVVDNGVLIIEFVVLSDLRFDRKVNDLYSNLPISVLDLLVGTKVEFKTISGKTLEVNIKEGTQPWMQLKIMGEGFPNQNGGYGDQILLLKPFIPDNINTDIIESIKRSKSK